MISQLENSAGVKLAEQDKEWLESLLKYLKVWRDK